ncbi:MAG: phosphoribosylanthranilate isomerase, partial [Treponema sp.]|nr:phosphoribosylanthranilate isomerase [Treponema sp.]
MNIKICGLFRDDDIDYVNEARPDYIGFVFAESRRQVRPAKAAQLRQKLLGAIIPAGVFVNAPVADIAALYRDGVITIAQLHGTETAAYITRLKEASAAAGKSPIPVIKTIFSKDLAAGTEPPENADFCLVDSGAGSGKIFDWNIIKPLGEKRQPLFLAGGINLGNIEQAMALNPFAVDISSGAETEGVKDREKILRLVE